MSAQKKITKTFHGLIVLALLLHVVTQAWAHEDNQTHARLTIASFLFLDQTYPADGALFSSTARGGVRQGSIREDDDPLFFNHFFNPKTGKTLDTSGFPLYYDNKTAPERAFGLWESAIEQYRGGQTDLAFTNLGHVIHLLQDMTSPAHVHLDPHGDPRSYVIGMPCEGDTDDFENWGYCDDYPQHRKILEYVAYTNVSNSQILPRLSIGLQRIFTNQPQAVARLTGENFGYAYVSNVADRVYDFTSFKVILEDTSHPFNYDRGGGELTNMFPSLIESTTGGWEINNLGWSQGECGGNLDQDWWLMNDGRCVPSSCGVGCTRDEGWVYIENVGGGDGGGSAIPDTLRPAYYNRLWFRQRYTTPSNGSNISNVTMLRIYGDVLYPAAVAYGAGLLQAFLDDAIMPKPITDRPTEVTGLSAQLNGRVSPAGEDAWGWFEWGTSTSYGTTTTNIPAGQGQGSTNVYYRIDGLALDTVYHFRIVSSNQFGVRHGTNQTFRTPAVLITGNVPNAWQITDRSDTSSLGYTTNLNTTLQQAANTGWRYTIKARMVDDFGDTITMNFLYGLTAVRRFLVWWDLDSSRNLTALVEGQPVRVIATNGFDATFYHTHELIYTNGTATYLFDGAVIAAGLPGVDAGTTPAGLIAWGGGSSAGQGQMNFHQVQFEIAGRGVVASYHAGSAGPVPDPVTLGWTANPASPALPNAFTPILPDFEPYSPLVETLNASEVDLNSARLNGRGDPRGQPVFGWFEWGTSTTYGNETLPRDLSDGFGWNHLSESLTGLAANQTYHFRLVVSNAFTVVFGADQTVMPRPVVITASEVPAPSQFWFQFTGTPGILYEVLRSTDLSSWVPIGEGNETSPGLFEFLDTAGPAGGAFYRVRSMTP